MIAQAGLALAVCALLAWVAAPWLVATALLCLGMVIGHWWLRQRRWSLRHASGQGGWQVSGADHDWRGVSLEVIYLGPWLVGVRLDDRPVWLWPDSAGPEARRELRRRLRSEPATRRASG